ncbi:hypothetical protein Tco_0451054 [Tanacetum coccineum]
MSAKDSITTQTCELSQEEFNEFLSLYPVPSEYHVIFPKSNQTIFDAPLGFIYRDSILLAVPSSLILLSCVKLMVVSPLSTSSEGSLICVELVYNWETATYGKIWCNEDVHDLRSVETEFPAIVFDDAFTSEPTVSPLNEIKLTLEYQNDNDKVNMPSFSSPNPTVSCIDDLDFFKEFKNEFPAIIYNDALMSKLDFLTEPTVSTQHIDEFNLKDDTSLYEFDEEE